MVEGTNDPQGGIVNLVIPILTRWNILVSCAFRWLAVCLVVLMTSVILLQIGSRLFFDSPLAWPEEAAKAMMVWISFLVAPAAYRSEHNIRMDFLLRVFPHFLKQVLAVFCHISILFLALILFRESLKMVERGLWIKASTMDINMAFIYAVLPLSFASIATVSVEKLIFELIKIWQAVGARGKRTRLRRQSHDQLETFSQSPQGF